MICEIGPSNQNPGHAYAKIQEIFMFGHFSFNQSKTNAVLEPRTEHFRELVGLDAKTKDFKMCPRGQGRPRGLHI